jgi:hypothetical protein
LTAFPWRQIRIAGSVLGALRLLAVEREIVGGGMLKTRSARHAAQRKKAAQNLARLVTGIFAALKKSEWLPILLARLAMGFVSLRAKGPSFWLRLPDNQTVGQISL